jgi:hypothetical protein
MTDERIQFGQERETDTARQAVDNALVELEDRYPKADVVRVRVDRNDDGTFQVNATGVVDR